MKFEEAGRLLNQVAFYQLPTDGWRRTGRRRCRRRPRRHVPDQIAIAMIWPYDDRCRLLGEDVWEFDPAVREHIKLDPADVLTARQAGDLLDPLITPLPAFDDRLLSRPTTIDR